ncbi:MAG: zinc-dependent peptidase [Synechococcaceae cyanobacterium SM2_3_1]|nr:zinc-dependent peptidase [Synechococcaceae cyanobacterium SM2_3_1]
MLQSLLLLLLLGLILLAIWGWPLWTRWRRHRLRQRPFPQSWQLILEQQVSLYHRLPPPLQQQLREHMQVFLIEKQFIGCNGLVITDEIRISIAAQACLLLLNGRGDYFPRLASILVYPHAYQVQVTETLENHIVQERWEQRLGESWQQGQLLVAWDQVNQQSLQSNRGHNVILHEFAHQLDQITGSANGVPSLKTAAEQQIWTKVFRQAYEQLQDDIRHRRPTVLNPYGATHPAEFFAVATEAFFERSASLQQHHPELYAELKRFYQLDPAKWSGM